MSAFDKQFNSIFLKVRGVIRRVKTLEATLKTWHMALPHMAGILERSVEDLDSLIDEIKDILEEK